MKTHRTVEVQYQATVTSVLRGAEWELGKGIHLIVRWGGAISALNVVKQTKDCRTSMSTPYTLTTVNVSHLINVVCSHLTCLQLLLRNSVCMCEGYE
jgi:hypothetical protein